MNIDIDQLVILAYQALIEERQADFRELCLQLEIELAAPFVDPVGALAGLDLDQADPSGELASFMDILGVGHENHGALLALALTIVSNRELDSASNFGQALRELAEVA